MESRETRRQRAADLEAAGRELQAAREAAARAERHTLTAVGYLLAVAASLGDTMAPRPTLDPGDEDFTLNPP